MKAAGFPPITACHSSCVQQSVGKPEAPRQGDPMRGGIGKPDPFRRLIALADRPCIGPRHLLARTPHGETAGRAPPHAQGATGDGKVSPSAAVVVTGCGSPTR